MSAHGQILMVPGMQLHGPGQRRCRRKYDGEQSEGVQVAQDCRLLQNVLIDQPQRLFGCVYRTGSMPQKIRLHAI